MEMLSSLHATPFTVAVKQHMETSCSSDFALSSNYPLGSPGSARYMSIHKVHELIQNYRTDIPGLLTGYFKLFHTSLVLIRKQECHIEHKRLKINGSRVSVRSRSLYGPNNLHGSTDNNSRQHIVPYDSGETGNRSILLDFGLMLECNGHYCSDFHDDGTSQRVDAGLC